MNEHLLEETARRDEASVELRIAEVGELDNLKLLHGERRFRASGSGVSVEGVGCSVLDLDRNWGSGTRVYG